MNITTVGIDPHNPEGTPVFHLLIDALLTTRL